VPQVDRGGDARLGLAVDCRVLECGIEADGREFREVRHGILRAGAARDGRLDAGFVGATVRPEERRALDGANGERISELSNAGPVGSLLVDWTIVGGGDKAVAMSGRRRKPSMTAPAASQPQPYASPMPQTWPLPTGHMSC